MLLKRGFILGSDARILDLEDDRIMSDQLKIRTIRENPLILGLMCGDFEVTENLVEYLRSKATNNESIKELVKYGTSFVDEHRGRVAFTTYMCYIEDGVPSGHVFYFVPVFDHKKECKEDYTCKCLVVGIRSGAQKLEHGAVYNDGSGASDAHDTLFMPFSDGEEKKQVGNADDYQIVNIKRKLNMDLRQARKITCFAMLKACLKDNNCGAPFRVCSVSIEGKVEREGPYGFIKTYLDFYEGLMEANTLFLIYHKRLEGSNFGFFVVENIPIVREKVKYEGHRVALLEDDLCLHRLTLEEQKDVDAALNFASTYSPHMKVFELNMKDAMERNLEAFELAKFSNEEITKFAEKEKIYMAKPSEKFLKSLTEKITRLEGFDEL
ncbi:hypothetical protein ACFX13_039488 [Malus domestica]